MRETASANSLDEIGTVRGRTLDVLDRLTASAEGFDLPRPSDALESYRNKLRENRYTVLVAGEAKRGKSTFVNAILGRDLLPTDVDIATCQVFRVRQAPDEGFRVRYEDDSAQEITAADLPRFGSQVLADAGEAPRLGQLIRWIEVEGPIHFLPKEITLLDTPGLGSLYAAHGRITRRYVPLADAVIFVLSSDSPLGREETQFLEEILGVTRSVLFIQTMIDRYKRAHWEAIQARNQQILAETFGDRLPEPRVWPISSTNLLKGAQTGDPDYEEVSQFRPLATALQGFLFRASGWSRTAEAIMLATDYQQREAEVLASRQAALLEESAAARIGRQTDLVARKRAFEAEWGPHGLRRRLLLEDVRKEAQLGRRHFQETIGLNGKIHDRHQQRIAAVQTLAQAHALTGSLAEDVVRDAGREWDNACQRTQERIAGLLGPFLDATQAGIVVPHTQTFFRAGENPGNPRVEGDWYPKARAAFQEGRIGFTAVSMAATLTALIVPSLVATSLFLPVAVLGALGAGLVGMLRGIDLASCRQLQDAKRVLDEHLRKVVLRIQQYYTSVDHGAGRFALVEEYFDGLVAAVAAHIEKVADAKSREAQSELRRLADEARLDEQQRKVKAEELSRQINSWTRLGADVLAVGQQLDHLERAHLPLRSAEV